MNKLSGIIMILFLVIVGWFFLSKNDYGFYNSKFDYNVIINQNSRISDIDKLTHDVINKTYESIGLYSGDDRKYYNSLIEKGVKCKYNPDALIEADITCFDVAGYQHLYKNQKLGVEIESFKFSSSHLPMHNVLEKEESNPFLLSGNRIYDISSSGISAFDSYIEYYDFNGNETIDDVLNKAKGISYEGFNYDSESGIITIQTGSLYMISYKKGDNYPMNIFYNFKENKSYYYTINYGVECIPGPCGLKRHDIRFFMK